MTLRDGARSVLKLVVRANARRDKAPILLEVREQVEELKVLLRLGQDVKAFANFYSFEHACAIRRARLAAAVEDYRIGLVPLVVPITLFNHYVELCGVEYLKGQTYLAPHPKELLLRNHV
ncbi:MAG: hypothetical protein ACI8TX_002127 [Hyphomicrobiaceae bacterium]